MPYVCCGDPSGAFTVRLVKTLVDKGAGAIEFRIPFSDPIADGKAIQAASSRAPLAGMTPEKAIAIIAKLRKEGVGAPIIAMTYYNIAFAFGQDKFARALKAAGAQGLIVPDVPLEESWELRKACSNAGIDLVYLITPNCSSGRLHRIAAKSRGFLYAVAVLGITVVRKDVSGNAKALVRRAKKISRLPVVVGFGISKPAHAAKFARAGADGVIVGSEIVNIYSKHILGGRISSGRALAEIGKFARKMNGGCLGK